MRELRIAHVGCGYWGKNLARNFAELGALDAIVDDHRETAERIAGATGARIATLDEVLADSAIDGLSFATPAETHAALALRALESGKHVYVEKPVALSLDDAQKLIDVAARHDRRLMVGHLLQYHPIFRKMREMVRSGAIGDLSYVYSNRMSLGKFRTEENVLWSFAPHDVSMILSLVDAECTGVTAQGAAIVTPGIEDWALLQLRFANGLKGHIQTSWLHPFKEQRLVAIGSEGMLVFEDSASDWDSKLRLYRHFIDRDGAVPTPHPAAAEAIIVEKSEPLRNECQHFLDSIANGTPPLTDGVEGLAVLNVLRRASDALTSAS
ncbi:Gfo/Idh/MocA family protein [Sphingopyxis sp. EG6]|uniref:Gfo/Idh/MocA family protein n=1 Tax=Sphingopyxis sp. EG6 TaxID=1874061 RepID=UPI000DC640FB|nr:Gfo/Idh/MocA family oxidoreductase [Sphingopyxis sp. EG6]BBB08638.1 2,3,4,5-tetrahydropyridine-2,6-dicarboxylate N-acetyltransferase [Sphingopyxis sp. EG6]